MRTVSAHKAQSVTIDIEPCSIELIDTMPQLETIALQQRVQDTDARELAKALHEHLPGGTFDRLVAEMLRIKASDLISSFVEWEVR